MSDPKPDETANVPSEEKKEEEASSSAGFGSIGASWLNSGSTWGASFLNSAKEKTMTTLDLMKKDFTDLSEAVTAEVNDLASAAKEGFGTAATAVKNQAQMFEKLVTPTDEEKSVPCEEAAPNAEGKEKEVPKESGLSFGWMTKIVDSVTDTVKSLAMEETTNGEDQFTEVIKPKKARNTCLSKAQLKEIESNESTFTAEPENSEYYDRWLSKFKLDEYDGEVNILLANNPALREMFSKLVPSQIENETFWQRYFYAIDVLELQEEMNKSTLSEALNIDVSPKKGRKKNSDVSKKSSPSSEGSVVVVEEPTSPSQSDWSVCSEKNVEEILSNDEDDVKGPLTPKVDDKKAKKEDGWVDWDE